MMRPQVVLFGSGSPISTQALTALAGVADVVGVVVPAGPRILGPRSAVRAWHRGRASAALRALAREQGAPSMPFDRDRPEALAEQLRALRPDLIAVATFPALLPLEVLQAAPAGAIGIHPSPLPRHRGPAPLFWTYHDDDAEAGVSVFRLDEGADTGALLARDVFPLERGRLGSDLYAEIARRGAARLARMALEVPAGRAMPVPQDESRATREPFPRPGHFRIDFGTWGAERVWHFLRGVGEGMDVLATENGRPVSHGPARAFVSAAPQRPPGTIERHAEGLLVHCRDGQVIVAPAAGRG